MVCRDHEIGHVRLFKKSGRGLDGVKQIRVEFVAVLLFLLANYFSLVNFSADLAAWAESTAGTKPAAGDA